MRLIRTITVIVAWVMAMRANAQEFTIRRVELTNDAIILYYDLVDTIKSRTYSIQVYSSRDNFLAPLQKIKGDAGLEVRPGENRKITWSSKEELGPAFNGDVELEVRGRIYIPFVKFDGFQEQQVIRRGKPKMMTWSGGTRQNILNFAIYNKEGQFVDVIPNVANSGSYEMILPTSIKPGRGYYFMVSDSKNKDQVMKTPAFEVRRKVPLALKAIPVLLIGGVAAMQQQNSGPKDLAAPPDVPTSHN